MGSIGANLTLKGKDGKTLLDLAIESGNEKTILILREGISKRLKPKRDGMKYIVISSSITKVSSIYMKEDPYKSGIVTSAVNMIASMKGDHASNKTQFTDQICRNNFAGDCQFTYSINARHICSSQPF